MTSITERTAAPTIEQLEEKALQSGEAKYADLRVCCLHKRFFIYTVCEREVSRDVAARAFA